jgi:ubiquinol-cytochrome c reductase cytochrome c1 subunit
MSKLLRHVALLATAAWLASPALAVEAQPPAPAAEAPAAPAAGEAPVEGVPPTDAVPGEPAPPEALAPAPEAAAPVAPASAPPAAAAAHEVIENKEVDFSFEGVLGTYDRAALQRGFQVYKEVCSACHGISRVAIRTLADPGGPGFTEAEVRALAAQYQIPAGPNELGQTVDENGQTLMRPAIPADTFPSPFANENAARAANNGSLPPDLSLIVRARADGADYVYSLLTGYEQPPAGTRPAPGRFYNAYFPGHQIAMPPPINPMQVTYADGTEATVQQMTHDLVTFLTWAGDPKMEERKRTGFAVLIFLLALSILLFHSYRKVWHGKHDVGATGGGGGHH